MSEDAETARAAARRADGGAGDELAAGMAVGNGRYAVESRFGDSPVAVVYEATEKSSKVPVSLHVVRPALLSAGARDLLSGRVAVAQELTHKNLVLTRGVIHEAGRTVLVTDPVQGHTLRQLLVRKKSTGAHGFGARGTHNVMSAILGALEVAHQRLAHGALCTDTVYVNRAGRVCVSDVVLGALLPRAVTAGTTAAPGWLAPEVGTLGEASIPGDIFSLGALLYELLVGRPLVHGGPRPSEVEDTHPDLDELVARCVAPTPPERPQTVTVLRAVLDPLLPSGGGRRAAAGPTRRTSASPGGSLARTLADPNTAPKQRAVSVGDAEEKWLIARGKLDYGPFGLAEIVDQVRRDEILPGHYIVDRDTGQRTPVEEHPLLAAVVDEARQRRDDMRRAQAEVSHARRESRRGVALYVFIGAGALGLAFAAVLVFRSLEADLFAPSVTSVGATGNARYGYVIVAVTEDRQRRFSETGVTATGAPQLTVSSYNRIQWAAVEGVAWYEIYRVESAGKPDTVGLIAKVGGDVEQFDDVGFQGDDTLPQEALAVLQEGELNLKINFPPSRNTPSRFESDKHGRKTATAALDFGRKGGNEVLSDDEVNAVIRRHSGRLGRCLISRGARRADIELTIMRTGRVANIKVDGANAAASKCIHHAVKAMRFRSFDGSYTIARFDMSL